MIYRKSELWKQHRKLKKAKIKPHYVDNKSF